MSGKAIPKEIKEQVQAIVARFNAQVIQDSHRFYIPRYRKQYLYLDRSDFGTIGPICRLRFNGKIDDWGFAIYKYSSERYDPDEWFFPGQDLVDGTIEGAMKAGLEAYPG